MKLNERKGINGLRVMILAMLLMLISTLFINKAKAFTLGTMAVEQNLCGQVITENLTLTSDIGPCPEDGIIIVGDGIVIDGDGHKIIGSGTGVGIGIGIPGGSNVIIEKLFVVGFSTGIYVSGGSGNQIAMNVLRQNDTAVSISSFGNGEGNYTDDVAINNVLTRNIIDGNELGLYVNSSDNFIYHNIIFNNDEQILELGTNHWEDPEYRFGNYWGNYWGEDDGSDGRIAGDYVGDTRLPHEGSDNYPLLDPSIIMRFGPLTCGDWWTGLAGYLVWRGGWSPVEIQVIDPFGQILSQSENQIGVTAFYAEENQLIPGETLVHILIIPCSDKPFEGTYRFQMSGFSDLDYWVTHTVGEIGNVKFHYSINGVLGPNESQTIETNLESYVDPDGNKRISAQLTVSIDIKPDSPSNCINSNGHGVIPLAILSNKVFDATRVNPSTLSLDGQAVKLRGKGTEMETLEDINGDGLLDMVVKINDIDSTYKLGDTMGTLRGLTYDNVPIIGVDRICVVP